MKRWDESQILFIYDKDCILREEDDPRNAIVFFHPSDTSENIRCTLCCQLMGVVQFCKSAFAPPKFITLERIKFAIKISGRFLLGLSGSLDMPDSVLIRQLNLLNDTCNFYRGSLDSVFEDCDRNRDLFEDELKSMCRHYLKVSQHFGNTHSLTFNIVPTLELPKSAGSLFLRASQIIEVCQTQDGILAGCILCKKQVLFSQLPPSIVRHLCNNSLDQSQLSKRHIKTVYELPEGIFLVFVYLTDEELLTAKRRVIQYGSEDETENRQLLVCSCTICTESQASRIHNSDSNANCVDDNSSDVHKVVLYVQSHSDIQLLLLMEESKWNDPAKIFALWRIGLSSLIDLELDIKNCWENSPIKKDSNSDFLYIQYDHIWGTMKGDLLSPLPEKHSEQLFNRSSQLIHESLNEGVIHDPDSPVEEISLLFANTVLYTHSVGSIETHCQFNITQEDEIGHSLITGSNMLHAVVAKAKRKLERFYGLVLT